VNKLRGALPGLGFLLLLLPSLLWAQTSTDRSELDQFLKETANQGPQPPVGTKITTANWQQYKAFLPFGMVKLFQGQYQWQMPQDAELDIGPARYGNLPKTWIEATEKYGGQDRVEVLPNGHFKIDNYQGGVVFPNPEEPHKGFKILANVFFAHAPAIFGAGPENTSAIWFVDRFGNVSQDTFDFIYRQSGWDTDAGFPPDESYAPGTWYTEWFMEETPEQARYTTTLALYYKDRRRTRFRITTYSYRRSGVRYAYPRPRVALRYLAASGPMMTRRSTASMAERPYSTPTTWAIASKWS
jgi:Protein of unknown function (DUF1329)